MRIRSSFAVASLLLAPALFAGTVPRFFPNDVVVHVGETVEIKAVAAHSGLTLTPTRLDWHFWSNDPAIAAIDGALHDPNTEGTVRITGLAEGVTNIATDGGYVLPQATVTVLGVADGWFFNKQDLVIEVGQTDTSVRVTQAGNIGKPSQGTNEMLRSADNHVANAYRSEDHMVITGISPGDTGVPKPSGGYYLTIHVVCGNELPVLAEQPVIAARAGEAVQLRVVSEIAQRTTFQWYAGRIGDTSKLLAIGGTELGFTASTLPKQYVWVLASTPCTSSMAEFEINVPPARGRAVRH